MAQVGSAHTLRSYTEMLAHASCTREGVPDALAERARDITRRNLAHLGEGALDAQDRRRVRAYYRGVVRRSLARSRLPGARECRIRAMAASVAADLRASGADQDRIRREVTAWLSAFEGAA
jgi:hypothetical protein